jgi:eukaryotic-like serine/threonine-protein kinase
MPQLSWRAFNPWVILALGGFLGVSGALLGALWLPAAWAAAVGGAITAVTTVLSARARHRLDQRWVVQRALPESLALRGSSGKLPYVRDVAEPALLGVHRAEAPPEGVRSAARSAQPAYIPRDVDGELRRAVLEGGFIVLIGESAAGKSRAAFEAMRSEMPGRVLAVPSGRESLAVIVASLAEDHPSVLWLDDLERFLGPGGLTPAMIADLTDPADRDAMVLATMRAPEYDRFSARAENNVSDPDRSAWRASSEVLRRARVISMSRLWSRSELDAAAEFAGDPRIAKALEYADLFGVAETLTAGPELVRDWRSAWAPGAHPRAAALVTAAVDCRRAGLDNPVSRNVLEKLHSHYLQARGGHALRPEPLEEAWAWALQPVHGASSLLVPVGSGEGSPKYLAFDYLIDLPGQEQVPPKTWDLLIAQADKAQARHIASEAYWRVRTATLSAVDSGAIDDVFLQAQTVAERGKYTLAIKILEDELQDAGRDVSIQSLRQHIAYFNLQAGNVSEAEAMFRQLLAEDEVSLPSDHEFLRVARHNIASCSRRSGDLLSALLQFRQILADRDRYLGPRAMNTLATRGSIADIIAEMGNPAEAARLARELLVDEEEALGKDHTNTLLTRQNLADYLAQTADVAGALEIIDDLLPDLIRALGADHPQVLDCRWQKAQYAARAGNCKQAKRLFQDVLAHRERVQGPENAKLKQEHQEFEAFCAGSESGD